MASLARLIVLSPNALTGTSTPAAFARRQMMQFHEVSDPARFFLSKSLSRAAASTWRLLLFTLLFVGVRAAEAQFNASLRGTVADQTGAIIPGATVTLLDKDTNQTRTSVTDGGGIFNFSALAPDHFSLTVEREGFKKKSVGQVVLIPEQANVLNVQMEIGGTQETVTVNGSAAPLLDTGTATVSQTISSEEIQHLPSFNRDVFQLAQLAPERLAMPRRGQAAAQTICRATQDQVAPPAAPPESSRPRTRCRSRHAAARQEQTASPSMASAP